MIDPDGGFGFQHNFGSSWYLIKVKHYCWVLRVVGVSKKEVIKRQPLEMLPFCICYLSELIPSNKPVSRRTIPFIRV